MDQTPVKAEIIAEPSPVQQILAEAPIPAIEPGSELNLTPIEEI